MIMGFFSAGTAYDYGKVKKAKADSTFKPCVFSIFKIVQCVHNIQTNVVFEALGYVMSWKRSPLNLLFFII